MEDIRTSVPIQTLCTNGTLATLIHKSNQNPKTSHTFTLPLIKIQKSKASTRPRQLPALQTIILNSVFNKGILFPSSSTMASPSCFLHHPTPAVAARTPTSTRPVPCLKPSHLICRAQKSDSESAAADAALVSRRLALTVLIGAAAVGSKVSPADAAYGESANIFGKPKTNTDFKPYNGNGFKLLLPSKWNPGGEVEYPGQVLRYEDNFDSTTNVTVLITPCDKKSITDYGPPEEFLSKLDFLLGKQVYSGQTDAEGGFESGAVATANILETSTPIINGVQYYNLSVLTRTADGTEGGRHQLITAAVKDGKLFLCKAQAGDKRWFKGARKYVESAANSFSLA